jgi:nucleoside-diphosphate-sugar epimerase
VPEAVGQTFNVGTGQETSISDLADQVISLVASYGTAITRAPSRPGDIGRLCADATAARDILGFTTTRSLRDAILELAARFRDNPRGLDELLSEEEEEVRV